MVATEALHQATTLDHPVSLCLCGIYKVTLFLWRGEWSEAESIMDKFGRIGGSDRDVVQMLSDWFTSAEQK
jgi:hypothetical protein